MACHHRLWAAHTVELCRAWHDISALGKHTRSNDVRRYMPSPLLESTHRQTTLGVVLPSSPYGSTHGPTPSGVACQHRLWAAQTVERHPAWHAIIALRQHTRSNNVGRGMPSPPLDKIHTRTTSGVACYHVPWTAQTVKRCRALHAIIALGRQIWSNDVVRGIPSSPLH